MMTLRCTQKLLQRLPLTPAQEQTLQYGHFPPPSTALGDWFATLLFTRPAHLVLCVNEKSRLYLLLPAREPKQLVTRFQQALLRLLHHMGVPTTAVAEESKHLHEVMIGSTQGAPHSRSVLGSLNEFSRMVKWELQWREWSVDEPGLLELSLHLSGVPCGPLGMELPHEVARRLLQQHSSSEDAVSPSPAHFVFRPRLVQ
jgi:hypothetical protein